MSGPGEIARNPQPAIPPSNGRQGRELKSSTGAAFPTAWARTPAVRALREVVQVAGLTPLTHSQVSLDVHGLEELREFDTPAIIVANHSSHLDTGVLLSTLPARRRRRTAVAAAADYFFDTWWRAGGSAIAFNTFPIERGHGKLATPGDLLAEGWSIIVYPEGTRSPDGYMGRFKLGAAWLAVQHQVPVIPVGLRGTYGAMPRGSSWVVRGRPRVSVRYGPPLVPGEGETIRQFAPRISAAVQSLVAEDETSWWAAQRRLPRTTADPPLGSWRRTWEQSEPPVEGGPTRGSSIWRG